MQRTLLIALAGLLAVAPAWAGVRRELNEGVDVGDSRKVVVDFEVGELRLDELVHREVQYRDVCPLGLS